MVGLSWRVALKASLVSLVCVVASVVLVVVSVPMLGGVLDQSAWVPAVACPLLLSWPISAYLFRQNEKMSAIRDEIGSLHAQLLKAHAELTDAHAELGRRAARDGMTGLLNRESFLVEARRRLFRDETGVLLILDVDHFKAVNDRFGHPTGDAALVAIADAMSRALRKDDLSGRIGGEEFGVYLGRTARDEVDRVCRRLRAVVSACAVRSPDGSRVSLSISIGAARGHRGADLQALLVEADSLLYRAKQAGRDRAELWA